jgi:hypothetical protein
MVRFWGRCLLSKAVLHRFASAADVNFQRQAQEQHRHEWKRAGESGHLTGLESRRDWPRILFSDVLYASP